MAGSNKKPFVKPHQEFKGLASGGAKVQITNLHYEVTEDRLKDIFTVYGPVSQCKIVWDRHDRSTGEAFVIFDSLKGAQEAVKAVDGSKCVA